MSEAIYIPYAYTKLTNCVVHQILTYMYAHMYMAWMKRYNMHVCAIVMSSFRQKIFLLELSNSCINWTDTVLSQVKVKMLNTGHCTTHNLAQGDIPRLTLEIISSHSSSDLDGLPTLTEEDIIVEVSKHFVWIERCV